ncbi:lipoprotein [Ectopseudomonas mendocina]|nr:lipoprotein [Pseudomonas mendocina]
MKKTLPFALLLVAGLGLAACDKKEEERSQTPAAPATEAQPAAPAPTPEPPLPETNEPVPQDDMPGTDEPGANAPLSSPEGQPEQNQ